MLFPRNLFTEVMGGDNFGHIYLNSILTIITLLIMSKKKFILSLSIVFASTTLIEFLQLFTTRSFSYYDLFYNAIGIAVGVIFYKFLMLIITNSSVFFKKFFN
jgi:VanZ family protein